MSPLLFSLSEKTKLCGFLPGLIQGCITFSVSPLESQKNFVISLLNRHGSGPLYTKPGRNLVLLTQSQGKVFVRYIMCQSLKSGASVPSIIVIKMFGLFYLSCFWLWIMLWGFHPNPKVLKLAGHEADLGLERISFLIAWKQLLKSSE